MMQEAALNMFSKALAYHLKSKKITILILHPGWTKTDMGTQRASLKPETSIKGMIKVIETADLSNTGEFFDWKGNPLVTSSRKNNFHYFSQKQDI